MEALPPGAQGRAGDPGQFLLRGRAQGQLPLQDGPTGGAARGPHGPSAFPHLLAPGAAMWMRFQQPVQHHSLPAIKKVETVLGNHPNRVASAMAVTHPVVVSVMMAKAWGIYGTPGRPIFRAGTCQHVFALKENTKITPDNKPALSSLSSLVPVQICA